MAKLRKLQFLEGDPQLQKFPDTLLYELVAHCKGTRSSKIPGMRPLRTRKALFLGRAKQIIYYRSKVTGETLMAARFQYGYNQELSVFQEKNGSGINDGKAFIGVAMHDNVQVDKFEVTHDHHKWFIVSYKVWIHKSRRMGYWQEHIHMQCLVSSGDGVQFIEQPAINPDVTNDTDEEIKTESGQHQEQPSVSTTTPESHRLAEQDRSSTMRPKRRTVSEGAKRVNNYNIDDYYDNLDSSSEDSTDSDSSDTDESIVSITEQNPPRQLPVRGRVEATSSRDTSGAALKKAEVSPSSVQTAQNPAAQLSQVGSKEAGSTYDAPRRRLKRSHSSLETVQAPITVPSTAQAAPKPKLKVVFKSTPAGPVLRIKPADICDTVSKIFKQAEVAGIIDENGVELVVQTSPGHWRRLVRGDYEDFEEIYRSAVENGELEHIVVVRGSGN